MKNKYTQVIIGIIAFLVLGITTIASYAYFAATLQGNDTAYDTVITTGDMSLMLNDGAQVSLSNAIPGDSITKEFSVKNTGTVETTYDVYFSELLNKFEDKNDLVYTITSTNGCARNTETIMPNVSSEDSKMISSCSINPNQTHNYILTITFKEDGTNQDDNQGKKFSAKISINDYKEYQYIAKLANGKTVNSILKNLSVNNEEYNEFVSIALTDEGYFSSEYDNYCSDKTSACNFYSIVHTERKRNKSYEIRGTYIDNIQITNEIPQNISETAIISSEDSYYDIYAWYNNNIIYIYSDQSEIYLNEDSAYLFYYFESIGNLNLEKINASLVNNFSYAFGRISGYVQIDDSFNTSNVTNMLGTFQGSTLESYDFLNELDISNVDDMSYMFEGAGEGSDLLLTNFNTSNVTNMYYMFSNAKFNEINLGENFNAENVINMENMFYNATVNTVNLGTNFNAVKVQNVSKMFASLDGNTLNLGDNFNLKSNANVESMFASCKSNAYLGNNFNGKNITNMTKMFYSFYGIILDLGNNFNTASANNMNYMFGNMGRVVNIDLGEHFDTSNVINMARMFGFDYSLKTIRLGNKFVVNSNQNNVYIFQNDTVLETIYAGRDSVFNSEKNSEVFSNNKKLKGGAGTEFDYVHIDAEYARIDDPDNGKPGYFTLDPRYQ